MGVIRGGGDDVAKGSWTPLVVVGLLIGGVVGGGIYFDNKEQMTKKTQKPETHKTIPVKVDSLKLK